MDDKDKELYDKIETRVLDGLDESNAIDFFTKLSIGEYDRLIRLFQDPEKKVLPEKVQTNLVNIFRTLKQAKESQRA